MWDRQYYEEYYSFMLNMKNMRATKYYQSHRTLL